MRASQIVGLIVAFILLFPGLCFFGFGSTFVLGSMGGSGGGAADDMVFGLLFVGIGVAIFAAVWFLARYGFRRPPT